MAKSNMILSEYLKEVKEGTRVFENAFQGVARMILGRPDMMEKVTVNGRMTYDYKIFRSGKKHIIGMYNEINSFVAFVKDASEGGSSSEMAFVLVGEPGNGKTFFVDYLCAQYRNFLSEEKNRKFSFKFKNLEKLGEYGQIKSILSQTFEDPVILAMNLFDKEDENKEFLAKAGFSDKDVDKLYLNYRPLGACSDFVLNDIKVHCDYDINKILDFVEVGRANFCCTGIIRNTQYFLRFFVQNGKIIIYRHRLALVLAPFALCFS